MNIDQKLKDLKARTKKLDEPFKPFKGEKLSNQYVAFVDILGFGREVNENFCNLLENYEKMLDFIRIPQSISLNVTVKVFSDSFIISSRNIHQLSEVVKGLHMMTLANDFLIRGGIGFGSHIEVQKETDLYVVSQALNRAVEVEKEIKMPCVALHESVEIPDEWWNPDVSPFMRKILYFDGIRLISPFNVFWGTTARLRVASMSKKYPEHRDKYDWFLKLYEAVISGDPLIPPAQIEGA
ncbi:MAG: hypothetical protein HY879_09100 [Deltaproteobacteria bacterium]|nr:hypothetical protein [Deltaproteobacteria bacterium]